MGTHPTDGLSSATLMDLDWLAGSWIGEKDGEPIEEHWSRPAGDALMGMFRWVKEGKVFFYEFMTIDDGEEGLTLRIKHFNPGLIGWEEKDDAFSCVLSQVDAGVAVFAARKEKEPLWLVFEKTEEGLDITFDAEGKTPGPANRFRFKRVS
ncbi:MAG: DUF6265 family protein [Planctomycetota bacterium]